MAESRLIGSYPVIGIRSTIDGRRSVLKVRESLEDQTMNMAKAAKKLFEDNLKYPNGVMKQWFDMTEEDCDTVMKATTWNMADLGYFRGGGFSSRFLTRAEMPATMIRLNLVKGLGPVLQIAEGWTIGLPDEVSDVLWKRTDYTWPCTWFAPRCTGEGAFKTAYDVMNNWGANHGAISYGHIGADLITLCSILRIPVCMHNVPEEKIFRPAAWNAFGMDKEAQDYRACASYGPMYK